MMTVCGYQSKNNFEIILALPVPQTEITLLLRRIDLAQARAY
jgi:hypothetical protein